MSFTQPFDWESQLLDFTFQNGVDSTARSMEMQKILDDANNKTTQWHLTEIVDPAQCRMVTMPDSTNAFNKVYE